MLRVSWGLYLNRGYVRGAYVADDFFLLISVAAYSSYLLSLLSL